MLKKVNIFAAATQSFGTCDVKMREQNDRNVLAGTRSAIGMRQKSQ